MPPSLPIVNLRPIQNSFLQGWPRTCSKRGRVGDSSLWRAERCWGCLTASMGAPFGIRRAPPTRPYQEEQRRRNRLARKEMLDCWSGSEHLKTAIPDFGHGETGPEPTQKYFPAKFGGLIGVRYRILGYLRKS